MYISMIPKSFGGVNVQSLKSELCSHPQFSLFCLLVMGRLVNLTKDHLVVIIVSPRGLL